MTALARPDLLERVSEVVAPQQRSGCRVDVDLSALTDAERRRLSKLLARLTTLAEAAAEVRLTDGGRPPSGSRTVSCSAARPVWLCHTRMAAVKLASPCASAMEGSAPCATSSACRNCIGRHTCSVVTQPDHGGNHASGHKATITAGTSAVQAKQHSHASAAQTDVRLLIDAEHSYFQPAIDHAALHLMRRFNGAGVPVVYNTYQCYRKDTESR